MKPRLSIIIPCYNCAKTLREAVDSCYTQELASDEFEIIMIDDGSKDTTRVLMEQLALEHTNIHLLFHEVNKGGGAARNTGIKEARGEIIYCLDSDNIFAPDSVRPLLDFLSHSDVDGVAFHERRFFYNTNTKLFNSHFNTVVDRTITLLDIFNETNTLLDNFFYTKSSYLKTAGYPEHHGFDTQCFEMRYLGAGNTVRVLPNSIFYHRQAMTERSYFERVHASGLFSVNFMLAFEDIFHLFNSETQKSLITYPLFAHNKSYQDNILANLKSKLQNKSQIFASDYQTYCVENGRNIWLNNQNQNSTERLLVEIYSLIETQNFTKAFSTLNEYIVKTKYISPYLEFLSLRILHGVAGTVPEKIIDKTLTDINQLQVSPIKDKNKTISTWLRKNPRLYSLIQTTRTILKR